MTKYSIYHIPGVKVGCSKTPQKRVRCQGYTQYEILEEYQDRATASERELYWQEKLGYPKDLTSYETLNSKGLLSPASRAAGEKTRIEKFGSPAGTMISPENRKKGLMKAQATLIARYGSITAKLRTPEAVIKRTTAIKKPVLQLDLNNNVVKEWLSAMDAARGLNIRQGCIANCLGGRQETAYKFKWKFKN
jgi:hypothetical protein